MAKASKKDTDVSTIDTAGEDVQSEHQSIVLLHEKGNFINFHYADLAGNMIEIKVLPGDTVSVPDTAENTEIIQPFLNNNLLTVKK